jgi:hypothetical protein
MVTLQPTQPVSNDVEFPEVERAFDCIETITKWEYPHVNGEFAELDAIPQRGIKEE